MRGAQCLPQVVVISAYNIRYASSQKLSCSFQENDRLKVSEFMRPLWLGLSLCYWKYLFVMESRQHDVGASNFRKGETVFLKGSSVSR